MSNALEELKDLAMEIVFTVPHPIHGKVNKIREISTLNIELICEDGFIERPEPLVEIKEYENKGVQK